MNDITIEDVDVKNAAKLLRIYTYYVQNTAVTFEYDVPALPQFQNRMERIKKQCPYLVIKQKGRILGFAYAGAFVVRTAYGWSCEVTVYLDRKAQKKRFFTVSSCGGMMTERRYNSVRAVAVF